MIIFEFDYETHLNGKPHKRKIWWLSTTSCIGKDEENSVEIYEQLDAEASGLTDESILCKQDKLKSYIEQAHKI